MRNEVRPRLPAELIFFVTSHCHLRCKHCFYHETLDRRGEGELTFDEYERLSEGLDDFLVGLFCGGEPFMRKNLAEIVRLACIHLRPRLIHIPTNAISPKRINSAPIEV